MTWIDDNKGQVPFSLDKNESWKADKDSGAWDFTKQPNKYGYVNCLRWTLTANAIGFSTHLGLPINPKTHTPCGHWHTPEDLVVVT